MPRFGLGKVAVGAAALLAIAGLSLGAGAIAQAQSATQAWEVQVGGGGPNTGGPPDYEAQAFGPNPLIIRVGDTVKWSFAGAHTVTFNSGKPELPLILPGPAQGELLVGPAFFPAGTPGNYDGTAQVNSGVLGEQPGQSFSLTFTKTGMFGYVCSLHPGMRGEVEVREANAPLTETPAQAKARGLVTLQTLAGRAAAATRMVHPVHAGSLHLSLAGLGDGFGASALVFVNGNLTVRRGDWVAWTNADPFEIHTVTFTSGGQVPEFVQPRPQPSGPPQLVVPANVAMPTGDTYTGSGILNSGILTPGNSWAARIDAPAGSYDYFCVIHPWMKGTVTVSG